MDFKEIGVNARTWVDLSKERDYWTALVNAALHLWVTLLIGLGLLGKYIFSHKNIILIF